MGTVTAFVDEREHPLRRSTFTPAGGLSLPEALPADPAPVSVSADESAPPVVEVVAPLDPAAALEAVLQDDDDDDVDRGFPRPPLRGSLDDEDLVPLVDRHTDDTATVDLIGILQAQMQLRAAEAARFAAWEAEIRRIGTEDALDELERTRLHFTGVIPVQTGPSIVATTSAPAGEALVPERIVSADAHDSAPVIPTGTAPEPAANPHAERARLADEELLERADDAPVSTTAARSAVSPVLVVAAAALALTLVVVSLVLAPTGASLALTAGFAAAAALAASFLGAVVARFGVSRLLPTGTPASGLPSAWRSGVFVGGLVVGTVVGEGLVSTTAPGFGWQGFLSGLVATRGAHVELSIVAALVGAFVLALVVVAIGDRLSSSARTANTEQDQPAD
ncbi:hypothetical protein GCM10022256_05080 [Frondihabitans peucedani]|uniref:Uncharacterized protein n=2 Tax=Frondihabitans peucedani TaxID=598626 RepID=A0ABP8DYE7_9MICO